MLAKKEFRKFIKKLNKEKSNISFESEDHIILEKLKRNPAFIKAKTVLLYYPMKSEVNVLPLIDYLFKNNKQVALPKTYKEKIEFVLLDNNWKNNLVKGVLNTTEPESDNFFKCLDKNTVVIVPSLALGRDKSRLGHGKGYYDKFLSKNKNLFTIGICRDYSLFDTLPTDSYDVFLDTIISSNFQD